MEQQPVPFINWACREQMAHKHMPRRSKAFVPEAITEMRQHFSPVGSHFLSLDWQEPSQHGKPLAWQRGERVVTTRSVTRGCSLTPSFTYQASSSADSRSYYVPYPPVPIPLSSVMGSMSKNTPPYFSTMRCAIPFCS